MTMDAPALITGLTSLLLFGVGANVGRARGKYGIKAPAVTGHPDFEIAYRIQLNTVENALAFLPALWVFAYYVSAMWAGILGAAWLIGRVLYAVGYTAAPAKRGQGFLVSVLAYAALVLGGLGGVMRALFA